ncbi:TetR family transcriptional regulator [Nonomuraea sp. K274]|uniref:TetR family transcriptional regulator n=1 Tax=Nonomuraea cypriaca TaxID=1187855 RepID=A0A931F159_9ACTN|nr:TetR family transcriptional regulator [Nonomuraea cypriaca]MBF8189262.1 TetR family transcriptional regulator [Nonomuraea cypriaca]
MTRSAFLRARRPEHKQQRREAILAAARELALNSGVRNVSLGAVAEAVGLAKSNIVRYFGTREEIYLILAAEEWELWSADVSDRLQRDPDPGTDALMAALAETIVLRPLFCDLLSHSATSLEHNVSVPAARTFKHTVLGVAAGIGAEISRHCDLTEAEATELVSGAALIAGMLYPVANPPPTLAQVYAEDPDLAAACPQLLPSLTRALRALAAGLPLIR